MVSDKDGDMKIDSKELPLLSLRLQIQLEPYGIKLDTNKFEAMILEDNGEQIPVIIFLSCCRIIRYKPNSLLIL